MNSDALRAGGILSAYSGPTKDYGQALGNFTEVSFVFAGITEKNPRIETLPICQDRAFNLGAEPSKNTQKNSILTDRRLHP
jgi:hypothetical protein